MPAKRKPPIKTKAALARHFDVTPRTVNRWIAEGCPKRKTGFDPAAVDKWLLLKQERAKAKSKGVDPDEKTKATGVLTARDADVRLKKLRAEKIEEELKVQRAEVIPRQDVEKLLVQRMTLFKKELRASVRRLAPSLVGLRDMAEARQLLEAEHDRILWSCYGRIPEEYKSA
jgi:phage terminase Nu1 subunit (DNA packaging protein)